MRSSNTTRKIAYAALILALFVGMLPYGAWLNRVKAENDLGEAQIGQVEAGSFILNLMLLGGARGIAANMLWMNAQELQRAQEYEKLGAQIELITKLQPHFLMVWTYQGWNMAYNISVEWDDPKDKYDWIKRGIKFLKRGVDKNRNTPDLMWDTGWTYYHKYGFADEAIFFRRLFHDDQDEGFRQYQDPRNNYVLSPPKDDNFLLGFGWFALAQDLVDNRLGRRTDLEQKLKFVDAPEQHKGKPGDLSFFSMTAHAQTKYSIFLEKQSKLGLLPNFGEKARLAWQTAEAEWLRFGKRDFEAFNDPAKSMVNLDDVMYPEKSKQMSETQWYWTDRWGRQMNYPYWKERCVAEATDPALRARELFYRGRLALKEGRFVESIANYESGLGLWKEVLDNHRALAEDELNQADTGLVVNYYLRALKQEQREPSPETPFLALGEKYSQERSVDPFDALEAIPDSAWADVKRSFTRGVSASSPGSGSESGSESGAESGSETP